MTTACEQWRATWRLLNGVGPVWRDGAGSWWAQTGDHTKSESNVLHHAGCNVPHQVSAMYRTALGAMYRTKWVQFTALCWVSYSVGLRARGWVTCKRG